MKQHRKGEGEEIVNACPELCYVGNYHVLSLPFIKFLWKLIVIASSNRTSSLMIKVVNWYNRHFWLRYHWTGSGIS